MEYRTYRITIRFADTCRIIEVRAINMQAALADVEQAYADVEVIQIK